MTLRIECWSGPRNISTAFMYAWAQRSDTTVVDEPLYAAYLARFDRGHPMTDRVLADQSHDPRHVVDEVILGPVDTPVVFHKQMAHHLRGVPSTVLTDVLARTANILLTRAPADMLRSLSVQLPDCDIDDTGLPEQVDLLDRILAESATDPIVIDSQALLRDPPAVLAAVCDRLGLGFDPAMLSWPAGPKPYDGVWAPAWYANVHASTGFGPPRQTVDDPLPDRLDAILEAAQPMYDRLAEFAIDIGR